MVHTSFLFTSLTLGVVVAVANIWCSALQTRQKAFRLDLYVTHSYNLISPYGMISVMYFSQHNSHNMKFCLCCVQQPESTQFYLSFVIVKECTFCKERC